MQDDMVNSSKKMDGGLLKDFLTVVGRKKSRIDLMEG